MPQTVPADFNDRAEANLNLAMLYQASGRQDKVESQLRTALLRDPDFFPRWSPWHNGWKPMIAAKKHAP
jgi:hypothetical protein